MIMPTYKEPKATTVAGIATAIAITSELLNTMESEVEVLDVVDIVVLAGAE